MRGSDLRALRVPDARLIRGVVTGSSRKRRAAGSCPHGYRQEEPLRSNKRFRAPTMSFRGGFWKLAGTILGTRGEAYFESAQGQSWGQVAEPNLSPILGNALCRSEGEWLNGRCTAE